jgi:hypothetical protein
LTIFQGVREAIDHVARRDCTVDNPSRSLWLADGPTTRFDAILTFRHHDILADIHFHVGTVARGRPRRGDRRGSDPARSGFPVVKVIVPGLEHWSARHFDPEVVVVGPRAGRDLPVSGTLVFIGPSLSIREAKGVLPDAEYRAAIRRGDLTTALKERARIVGVIDGRFLQTLAVSPLEIFAACRTGRLCSAPPQHGRAPRWKWRRSG